MLMNLDDIIKSFKGRVDRLAQDWEAINSSPTHLGADEDELKLFKMKLDMVQEQNAAIMIDLDYIKKILALDEYTPSNPFTLLSTNSDNLHIPTTPATELQRPPSTPQSEPTPRRHRNFASTRSSFLVHNQLAGMPAQHAGPSVGATDDLPIATNLEGELRAFRKPLVLPQTAVNVPLDSQISEELVQNVEMTIPAYEDLHPPEKSVSPKDASQQIITGKFHNAIVKDGAMANLGATESHEAEHYDLKVIDNPTSVAEVYHEYTTSLKGQIEEFERLFGKGQLSKLPKIRTYQRRRALVTEIDKYATTYDKSTHEAIEFFERVRKNKKRTVPGLYNNLGKIMKELERSEFNND
ncbi:hypothetical protein HG537_0E03620 [Torulaspora globosa]|uniref:Transcription activator GCR1-like domain-containing protein n=1 Tax=Torulaspora globosa TaxID=48254 RepID=A0A7H9HW69_9SACH|nr:hypothetical protein HG537_0E03620 [Torulaspora sp. CBS 2947]